MSVAAVAEESGFANGFTIGDDGGEGDNAAPTAAVPFDRSPLKVLASLADKPLQQAMKAIEYIDSSRARERRFLKAVSPAALNLIAQNGPEYLTAVQASK